MHQTFLSDLFIYATTFSKGSSLPMITRKFEWYQPVQKYSLDKMLGFPWKRETLR